MRASCSGIVGTALPRTARRHPAGLAKSLIIWRCYSRRTGLLPRGGAGQPISRQSGRFEDGTLTCHLGLSRNH